MRNVDCPMLIEHCTKTVFLLLKWMSLSSPAELVFSWSIHSFPVITSVSVAINVIRLEIHLFDTVLSNLLFVSFYKNLSVEY